MVITEASKTALSSDDLEEIERFHTAWCEENGVKKTDPRALEVASGLIDWYLADANYRARTKLNHGPALPASEEIDRLLRQMT